MASGTGEHAELRNIVLPSPLANLPPFLSDSDDVAGKPVDDLTEVKGIGAVFNGRLQQAGIDSFAKLKAVSSANLADILHIRLGRAENILAEAADHG